MTMASLDRPTLVAKITLRAMYCKIPGPEVEISGTADGVIVRWLCRCKLYHEAKV